MKMFLVDTIFLLTMLGTSTASGNVSEEGKNLAYFHICFLRVIFLGGVSLIVANVQGTRGNRYFPRITLLLPLSYQTTAPTVHSKVLELL